MAGKNTAVFGIYSDRMRVEKAVDRLKADGFRNTDISVLFPQNAGTKDFAHEKHTKAPEGATTGAGTGAVVGGALGWLAGIGAIAIPGLGPFIAAGPIVAALAGAGAGSASAFPLPVRPTLSAGWPDGQGARPSAGGASARSGRLRGAGATAHRRDPPAHAGLPAAGAMTTSSSLSMPRA